jgi:hypothetical protein
MLVTLRSGQIRARPVRLRSHPEVGMCINYVHFLLRRAQDRPTTVTRQRLRAAAESIRGEVMARDWHQRPVIGPPPGLSRRLPW